MGIAFESLSSDVADRSCRRTVGKNGAELRELFRHQPASSARDPKRTAGNGSRGPDHECLHLLPERLSRETRLEQLLHDELVDLGVEVVDVEGRLPHRKARLPPNRLLRAGPRLGGSLALPGSPGP